MLAVVCVASAWTMHGSATNTNTVHTPIPTTRPGCWKLAAAWPSNTHTNASAVTRPPPTALGSGTTVAVADHVRRKAKRRRRRRPLLGAISTTIGHTNTPTITPTTTRWGEPAVLRCAAMKRGGGALSSARELPHRFVGAAVLLRTTP